MIVNEILKYAISFQSLVALINQNSMLMTIKMCRDFTYNFKCI